MKKPKIQKIRFIDICDLPNHEALFDHDLKLTIGEGMSIYSADESVEEIERHHDATVPGHDYSEMIRIIQALPKGVKVCWGG